MQQAVDPAVFLQEELTCPSCSVKLAPSSEGGARYSCQSCDFVVHAKALERRGSEPRWFEVGADDGAADSGQRNRRIQIGYRFYSLVYGPLALLSLWIIWRGGLRPLIRWYRSSYEEAGDRTVLDVGVGNGALARLACKRLADRVSGLYLDLSRRMLHKATKKLRKVERAAFLLADAAKIPLRSKAVDRLFCFGAIHVFSDRQACLSSMARVLRPGGLMRGSIVLRPKGRISQFLCRKVFKPMGLLTEPPTRTQVEQEFAAAGLDLTTVEWNGQMMLFEATRRETAAGESARV